MTEAFLKIVNMSISAGWLVLAVLMLRLLLRKAPKWVNVLLWGIVAVKLICPFSIESALSLIPSAETISPGIMMDSTPTITTGIPVLNNAINPVIADSFAPNPGDSANPLQIWIPIASWIWVMGMILMAVYTGFSYLRLRRRIGTAVLLRDGIFQSENVSSPFVLGILKPRIYLPFSMDGQEREHVIAHELAHIHRRDHWWKPLGFLLLTIHWFHPLMWLAYVLLCRDIELACDEKVIQELGNAQRADYTQALLACSVNRPMIAACPLAFGEVGVKERVKNVMHYKKPAFWIIVIAVVVCIVVAVCFLTDPLLPSLEVLPLVHSHSYSVVEVTYESPSLSFTMLPGVHTPQFSIAEDMRLRVKLAEDYTWSTVGQLEAMELNRQNFDDLFYGDGVWGGGEDIASIRKNTANAWGLVYNQDNFYYLLKWKNGELFLVDGYYDSLEKDDPGSDDTSIRRIFRLSVDLNEEYNVIAKSGENVVPLTIFPAGTAVGNYNEAVHWLTIDPGEDFVPFRIYQNGEEVMGHYFAFDAETYEQLPHMVPSGLDPQTYLFQNADPSREYIVGAVLEAETDADFYCFGVRFTEPVNPILQAKVVEVHDSYLLVQPVPGSWELNSANLIEVPMEHMAASPQPAAGDTLRIEYDGQILETYPARIAKVYSISVAEKMMRMINLNGIIYIDSGEAIPVEIDPSAISGTLHTQVEGRPQNHGQGNFDCEGCEYARVERNWAVLIDNEWYLFTEEVLTSPEYYLTIGKEGAVFIEVTTGSRVQLICNDDMSAYKCGESVLLPVLTGKENLRGVTITVRDADNYDIFSVSISAKEHGTADDVIVCDDWIITPVE